MGRVVSETRVNFSDRTPLPPGYAVEFWDHDEHFHWVLKSAPDDVYSDASWNKWDCWRGAWAHYRSRPKALASAKRGG